MSSLSGLGALVRLILRRDRRWLGLWILATVGIIVVSAASLLPTYPDQAAIDAYASLIGDNPALIAFAGPGYGFDDPNIGVILVNEVQLWGCIGVALLSVFAVNRHTRAEEDVERADLLRSCIVGRHAPAVAAVCVVGATQVLIALACVVGFVALGYPTVGSVALAGSLLAVGWVFVGVTLMAAQVASSGRATLGMASGALGAAFVLRAVGDVADNGLRWLSPIGWAQSVRAFAGERWWTLALCGVVGCVLVVAGLWISTRRDLGSGLVPQRPGRARARGWIQAPVGLAALQNRGSLIGWSVAMFAIAAVYGSIGDDIEQMVRENPIYADLLAQLDGADITDSFFVTSLAILALITCGYSLATVLRLRGEETAGRVEPILATPTSRLRWSLGHVVVAVVGTVLVMVAAGLGIGISFALVAGDGTQVMRMLEAALVTVPAILVLVGLAVLVFGWWPAASAVPWCALGVVAVIGLLGEVLRLPDWSRQLSPFEHLPAVPAEPMRWVPVLTLLALAAGLVAVGLWGFRRRDLRVG